MRTLILLSPTLDSYNIVIGDGSVGTFSECLIILRAHLKRWYWPGPLVTTPPLQQCSTLAYKELASSINLAFLINLQGLFLRGYNCDK